MECSNAREITLHSNPSPSVPPRSPLQPNSPHRPFPAPSVHLYRDQCRVLRQYWSPPHAPHARGAHDEENSQTSTPVTPSTHHTRLKTLFYN